MNAPATRKFRDPALVDCGAGRRLDRLGGVLVDWPCAAAAGPQGDPAAWKEAGVVHAAAIPGGPAAWTFRADPPVPWRVSMPIGAATITLEVRPAASGQVGLFLEQLSQWRWMAARLAPGARVLSLFAHSGAATLAAAVAGAAVVSVDASRQASALARRNAAASELTDRPIAWIEDDARKTVARLRRRGESFDAVVLDPPSWGHGTKGEAFAIDRDLPPLLGEVARLLPAAGGGLVLVTCHSPRWPATRLRDALAAALAGAARPAPRIATGPLGLTAESGRRLPLGVFARWAADPPP